MTEQKPVMEISQAYDYHPRPNTAEFALWNRWQFSRRRKQGKNGCCYFGEEDGSSGSDGNNRGNYHHAYKYALEGEPAELRNVYTKK